MLYEELRIRSCRLKRISMKRRFSLVLGSTVFAAMLPYAGTVEAGGCCYRAACDRGVATMSPLESPDPCDSPVGVAYRYTPYYQGFAIDRRCMPPMYGTVSTHGVPHPSWSTGGLGQRAVPYVRGGYGSFSGASKDESNLLHLGGFGLAGNGSYRPYHGSSGDMIDRIEGR
jgi:hypothetical protein